MGKQSRRQKESDLVIIPVSHAAAQRVMDGAHINGVEDSLTTTVESFHTQHGTLSRILAHITTLQKGVKDNRFIPPDSRFIRADPRLMIGGGALYYGCVKEEANLRQTRYPRISPQDFGFWNNANSVSDLRSTRQEDALRILTGGAKIVSTLDDQAETFDIAEADFCIAGLDHLRPENGWNNEHRQSLFMGAAIVRNLVESHYERQSQQKVGK